VYFTDINILWRYRVSRIMNNNCKSHKNEFVVGKFDHYLPVFWTVELLPLPSMSNSWPCDPTKVLDKNGAKSTMISRRSGHTEPSAASSLWVRDASLLGKCVWCGRFTFFKLKSSTVCPAFCTFAFCVVDVGTLTTDISLSGLSPRISGENAHGNHQR